MDKPITLSESVAVDSLRAFACIAIILCHFCQSYQNNLASVFVTGVQVFLVLSGFLYGKKTINNWGKWFLGKIKKLFIPYALLIIAVSVISIVVNESPVTFKQMICHLFCVNTFVSNGTHDYFLHLWFIQVIAICYVITPILQKFRKFGGASYALIASMSFFSVFCFFFHWTPLYVLIYAFAYYVSSANKRVVIFSLSGMSILALILLLDVHWSDFHMFTPRAMIIKSVAALLILFIALSLTNRLQWTNVLNGIKIISDYSFEIYLTHFCFIMGPLSVAHLTNYIWVNFLIVCVCTAIASYALKWISHYINFIIGWNYNKQGCDSRKKQ